MSSPFTKTALEAIQKVGSNYWKKESTIEIAESFLGRSSDFVSYFPSDKNEDRYVKIGRSILSMFYTEDGKRILCEDDNNSDAESPSITWKGMNAKKLESSLENIMNDSLLLLKINSDGLQVPKMRFGKTELEMPVMTLGTMRFQQTWNRDSSRPPILNIEDISDECQENLRQVLRYSFKLGMNHIETARMYGTSELQIGEVLKEMFEAGEVKREDLIIQTKVACLPTPKSFRDTLDESFSKLQVDYIDLFSFHGLNTHSEIDLIFNNGDNSLMNVIKEYRDQGKIRYVGFSTHGMPDVINRAIATDQFDYVNLHYHFCGSYTASGANTASSSDDSISHGNYENVKLCNEKDMGVFIISPYDKGGRVYAPSNKLRSLTLPEMEPIDYGASWLLHHDSLVNEGAKINTMTIGAARPSDLDQPAISAIKMSESLPKCQIIQNRLTNKMSDTFGESFAKTWFQGVPHSYKVDDGAHLSQILSLAVVTKAYGLLDYGKERYGCMTGHKKGWDSSLSKEDNIQKRMAFGFSWMPGCEYDKDFDYSDALKNVPSENKAKVTELLEFAHDLFSPASSDENKKEDEKKEELSNGIPFEYETSYDMRPWTAFPERS